MLDLGLCTLCALITMPFSKESHPIFFKFGEFFTKKLPLFLTLKIFQDEFEIFYSPKFHGTKNFFGQEPRSNSSGYKGTVNFPKIVTDLTQRPKA